MFELYYIIVIIIYYAHYIQIIIIIIKNINIYQYSYTAISG